MKVGDKGGETERGVNFAREGVGERAIGPRIQTLEQILDFSLTATLNSLTSIFSDLKKNFLSYILIEPWQC